MTDASTEETLIAAAIAGDRLSLGELLLEHAPRLSRQIAARLPAKYRPLVAVEDILQEVFCEASLNVARLRTPHRRAFSAWLAQVADYRAMHAVTRLRAQKRGGSQAKVFQPVAESVQSFLDLLEAAADKSETPSRPLQRKEAILAVQVSLATLPTVQREAVLHHHLDGKSVAETASAMGRTAAAVRGLLHRGKALRTSLGHSSRWFHNR